MSEAPGDVSPARLEGDRYTQFRAMLKKQPTPLSLENYLQAQTVFLLMDLLAEMGAQTELLSRLSADFEEIALRLPPWGERKAGLKMKDRP